MKYKLILEVLLGAVLLVGLIGCSKDDGCPNCPDDGDNTPYQGRVYVAGTYTPPNISVFDAATDSLIDSLTLDLYKTFAWPQVTADGKYLVVFRDYGSNILIFDAATLSQLGMISGIGQTTLVRGGTAIFGSRVGPLTLYSIPGGQLLKQGSLPNESYGDLKYDEATDLVYGLASIYDLFNSSDTTDIVVVDLDSLSVVQRFRVVDDAGQTYYLREVRLDFQSGLGYAIGFAFDGDFFVTFDAQTGRVKTRFPMYASFGDLKLSPDRSEVFVSDPGNPSLAIRPLYNPGKIFIFDAATGEHKEDIPLAGLQDDSVGEPPDVWDLVFTPDGSALYAVTGNLGDRYGTVLKFDPRTRQFLGSLFPNIDHYFYGAAVGPRAQ